MLGGSLRGLEEPLWLLVGSHTANGDIMVRTDYDSCYGRHLRVYEVRLSKPTREGR